MNDYEGRWDNVLIFDYVLILRLDAVSIGHGSRIDSFVKVEGGGGVSIGRYTHIASFCHVNVGGGRILIGDYVGIASGAKIGGGSNKMEGLSMSASAPADMQVVERKLTMLGDYSFVGMNAVVMAGVEVGVGAVIGAGAVVTKDVPAWEVWGGVPARKIGIRPAWPPRIRESGADNGALY